MSYKNLEIWKLARELSIEIHNMTLKLPSFELVEEGRQIRKSSKSVRSNIVEGYGRRYYKNDYIKFIIYSLSSNDETIDHLEALFETGSLTDERHFKYLHQKASILGRKLNNFLQAIQLHHQKPNSANIGEPYPDYGNQTENKMHSVQYPDTISGDI